MHGTLATLAAVPGRYFLPCLVLHCLVLHRACLCRQKKAAAQLATIQKRVVEAGTHIRDRAVLFPKDKPSLTQPVESRGVGSAGGGGSAAPAALAPQVGGGSVGVPAPAALAPQVPAPTVPSMPAISTFSPASGGKEDRVPVDQGVEPRGGPSDPSPPTVGPLAVGSPGAFVPFGGGYTNVYGSSAYGETSTTDREVRAPFNLQRVWCAYRCAQPKL
jgi:hypothetical protein